MTARGVTLTVRPEGVEVVERKLAVVHDGLKHPRKLMNILGAVLESSTRRRFRKGVGPDGKAWTQSARVRENGGKTLLLSGRLRDSITHDADDRQTEVGSNLIYAAIHQVGGVIRAKNGGMLRFQIPGLGWRQVAQVTIPARPYLGVSAEDRTELSAQVTRYIERQVAA